MFGATVAIALSCAACTSEPVSDSYGHGNPSLGHVAIEVVPSTHYFQSIAAGETSSMPVTITSVGQDTLYLEGLFIEGSPSFSVDDLGVERMLPPGFSTKLYVDYTPKIDGPENGALTIYSNAGDDPAHTVPLVADGSIPVIELSPATWDFGDHEIGGEQELLITVGNAGSAPLTVDQVVFEPTSDELTHITNLTEDPQLLPDETTEITIFYNPRDELPDTGYLHITSDDPARPVVTAVQFAQAHLGDEIVDEYEVGANNKTDILWVIDNSCSMFEEQYLLADHISAFFEVANLNSLDFQMGVVTTDNATLQGAFPIMTPSTPDVHGAFMDAVTVGTTGSGSERGLQHGLEALTSPMTDMGEPNAGFLREDAGLRVIFVSDEEDQSQWPVESYVTGYQSLKINPAHVVLNGFISQSLGSRYNQAIGMTGGLADYLENPDWANTLSQLAWDSEGCNDTFDLTHNPVPDTIEVELNHVPLHQGWSFQPIFKAVVLEPEYVPDPGDVVTIRYHLLGDCC